MADLNLTVSGQGPAVLWIHGYTMDSSLWSPLWTLLPGWRHVGVDLPGHGGSAPLSAYPTLPRMAAGLAEVARREDTRRVVGLSFGSSVALQLAIDAPELVQRLVVAAPTISGRPAAPGTAERYRQLGFLKRLGAAPGDLTDLWMSAPPDIFTGTLAHPEVRAALREVIVRHRWDELDNGAMHALTRHAQTAADLRRIRAATLAVSGERDMPAFVDNTRMLARTVPDCRILGVPGAGHLPLLEQPASLAGPLEQFLR
jgi:pimeloyl-ACP methyl ester carboxylesterase